MWNRHRIRGPATVQGRGGGVPAVLFQHPRRFHEDDELIAEIGLQVFASEPGLLLRERVELDATPPDSRDPLFFEGKPALSRFLARVRRIAMESVDDEHGIWSGSRSGGLEAGVLEFQFFLHVTLELVHLVGYVAVGARVWPSRVWTDAAPTSEFSEEYHVRQLIRDSAERALGR